MVIHLERFWFGMDSNERKRGDKYGSIDHSSEYL